MTLVYRPIGHATGTPSGMHAYDCVGRAMVAGDLVATVTYAGSVFISILGAAYPVKYNCNWSRSENSN